MRLASHQINGKKNTKNLSWEGNSNEEISLFSIFHAQLPLFANNSSTISY